MPAHNCRSAWTASKHMRQNTAMLLKSISISLILPPGIFVAAIAVGLLLLPRKPHFGYAVAWSALMLLTLSTMPIVSDMMFRVLERDYPSSCRPPLLRRRLCRSVRM